MPEAILAIAAKPSDYPEFSIPADLDLSGLKDGETKEMLAVIKKTSDGKACVVSIDGVKLGDDAPDIEDETDEQDDQSPPPEQPYPDQMMAKARSAGLM